MHDSSFELDGWLKRGHFPLSHPIFLPPNNSFDPLPIFKLSFWEVAILLNPLLFAYYPVVVR